MTDAGEAAALLRRGSARWVAVGSVWTTSAYLLREGTPAYAPAA